MLTKAGILPVKQVGNEAYFYVMKPPPEKPELEAPAFQIAKGTRMYRVGTAWHDCGKNIPDEYDELETLKQTALREAEEEIGLKFGNIQKMIEVGEVNFSSATTGKKKAMYLYAAFLKEDLPENETARWLSLRDAEKLMRLDHFLIVKTVADSL